MPDHPFILHTVPCLTDNYAYVFHNTDTGAAAVVDVPDAAPIAAKLQELNATLTQVFLTHHHWDHVDGLQDLTAGHGQVEIIGAKADAHRLPPLTQTVEEGDEIDLAGCHVSDI